MTAVQTNITETPVINFAEKTGSLPREQIVAQRRRAHPDRKLIEACVNFAVLTEGAAAGFAVDPTDSEFAAVSDDIARSRARPELATAARTKAVTIDGLRAKASLVRLIVENNQYPRDLEEIDRRFLLALANDIIRFQHSAMDEKTSHIVFPEPRR